nr:F40F12.6 protein - Caenorhabditis elegans [Caenorhabditis elegans]
MPGEFAKFPEQSAGSHQFRNPLDELTGSNTITNLTAHDFDYFTQSEKNSNLYTSENTSNSNRLNLNQNIPVGTLIDGFELINEASGSGFLDDQLVDVSDYSRDRTTKLDRNRNSPELIVALLQRKVQGIRFSSNYGREEEPCVIEIPPGTMVREMADDDWKMSELKEWFTKSRASSHLRDGLAMPMEELDCTPLICAMITRSDVMRINQDQAIHLLAVSVEKRIEVYQNFEWFNFILNLKIGDSVSVEVFHFFSSLFHTIIAYLPFFVTQKNNRTFFGVFKNLWTKQCDGFQQKCRGSVRDRKHQEYGIMWTLTGTLLRLVSCLLAAIKKKSISHSYLFSRFNNFFSVS